MILSFWTDRPVQTVQTLIIEEQSDQWAVWSGSTLFAILSASLDALLYDKATLFKF